MEINSKVISNAIAFVITFSIVIFMAVAKLIFSTDFTVSLSGMGIIGFILLFLVGILAAGTMVIPGVSGSLVLMLIGYYEPVIKTIKNLVHFKNVPHNLLVIGVFGAGIIVGIVGIARLFEYLFKKHETITYYGVLGFIFASVIAIPVSTFTSISITFKVLELIIGIACMLVGTIIAYKLGEK